MFSSIKNRWSAPQGYREVLNVGFPLVVGMISSTVMQFTDRLFLSRYSDISIAAALPATLMAMSLQLPLVGLCGYTSVFMAQYVGGGQAKKVGGIFWQGMWLALMATLFLSFACLLAEPLFTRVGHPDPIRIEETQYFQILTLGSAFMIFGTVISCFFIGRGKTRPVLVANLLGALLNIPLDYALIFGAWGLPELGIAGAGYATVIGWAFTALVLGLGVFTRKNDREFHILRAWQFRWKAFLRLLRFGVPSGINLFMEIAAFAWFVMEVGTLGKVALAASNIAFSINSLVFTPMLGLNTAVSTLVGQAMGRNKVEDAIEATRSALHISLVYMVSLCLVFFIFPGQLMDIFRPNDPGIDFASIRETGIVLIYYVAVYSLIDSFNIIYFGALKGSGDTLFIMLILGATGTCVLIAPIIILKATGLASLHAFWIVITAYVMITALCSRMRFKQGKWQKIRMVNQD